MQHSKTDLNAIIYGWFFLGNYSVIFNNIVQGKFNLITINNKPSARQHAPYGAR